MPHPTLTDIRAALSLIDCDAYPHIPPGAARVSEIDGYADGSIQITTPGLFHVAQRIDGQRWDRSTKRRPISLDGDSQTIACLMTRLSAIEDQGYGHIKVARLAAGEEGRWCIWGPTAAAIAAVLDVDCDSPEAAITSFRTEDS